MPELSPYPGWSPPQTRDDDCMRRAVACVIGVHPDRIPWIDPHTTRGDTFWNRYREAVAGLGFELSLAWPWPRLRSEARQWRDVRRPSGLWIGVSPHAARMLHAIVYHGDTYHFGQQHRKRHPNKLWAICTVTPIGGCA